MSFAPNNNNTYRVFVIKWHCRTQSLDWSSVENNMTIVDVDQIGDIPVDKLVQRWKVAVNSDRIAFTVSGQEKALVGWKSFLFKNPAIKTIECHCLLMSNRHCLLILAFKKERQLLARVLLWFNIKPICQWGLFLGTKLS